LRRAQGALALLALVLAACSAGQGETAGPERNIRLIVAHKPGGGFDLQARILAPFLEKHLAGGAKVVVENHEGAGGRLGMSELARSAPDGYTIALLGLQSIAFTAASGDLSSDPRDWTWLAQTTSDPMLVAVTASSGITSARDIERGDRRFGLTQEELPAAAILSDMIGGPFRPVQFDGTGDITLAGIRGDIDLMIASWPAIARGVNDSQGKLSSLFLIDEERLPALADVPTLAEAGIVAPASFYTVAAVARVLVAPAGVPDPVRDALGSALRAAIADPEFVEQMKNGQFLVVPATPAEIQAALNAAVAQFEESKELIRASGTH
jgi:tripartite-type tricarboxylate transporter receptor subunit TctC